MASCKCAGSSCSCSLVAGNGTTIRGTGTAANPFQVDIDASTLGFGSAITVADSATLDLTKTGSGSSGDPVVITGRVLLVAPNGSKYTLSVSNAGVLSAVSTT